MKSRIVGYLILFEVGVIIIVIFSIIKTVHSQPASVDVIDTKYLNTVSQDHLKYFYEPKPNTIQILAAPLLQGLGYKANSIVTYTINKDGLNQKTNYNTEKSQNTYRIMTIGDSFTFGQNVNTDNNYPSQLEKLINAKCSLDKKLNFQVLNLGVAGYDMQYAVERYKIRGQKYNPDLIIWFVVDSDFTRVSEETLPVYRKLLEEATAGDKLAGLKELINYNLLKEAHDRIVKNLGGENEALKLESKYLFDLNTYYTKKLLVFTFSTTANKNKQVLSDFAKSRIGISTYLDLPDIYNNQKYYLKDRHPSAAGYSFIIKNLFDYLTRNKIIPCS